MKRKNTLSLTASTTEYPIEKTTKFLGSIQRPELVDAYEREARQILSIDLIKSGAPQQRGWRWCGGCCPAKRCVFSHYGVCHNAGAAAAPRVGGGLLWHLPGVVSGWGGLWASLVGGVPGPLGARAILAQAPFGLLGSPLFPPSLSLSATLKAQGCLQGWLLASQWPGKGWGCTRALWRWTGTPGCRPPTSRRVPQAYRLRAWAWMQLRIEYDAGLRGPC